MKKSKSYGLVELTRWTAIAPLIGCLAACSPGASAEVCAELNATIDRNIVEIATSAVEGDSSDKSAVQQGARLTRDGNRLSTIMLNLQLQSQNKCQPRQKPIDPSIYPLQAMTCHLARLEQVSASYGSDEDKKTAAKTKTASICDFKTWNTPAAK